MNRRPAACCTSAASSVDLYAGVGLFSGVLPGRVVAVEGRASAAADARVNLRDREVRVVRADVTRWKPQPADFVVADPARAGLGRAGVDVVVGCDPATVALVSCDPASLARDARLLVDHGYRLASVTPVDLFPHTFHVETVSVFRR
jgi:23S rRNA (uracil1939-C5)-methyltransferase